MNDTVQYRVWPDGTVQEACDAPYSWMSDDYMTINAFSEEDAFIKAALHESTV